MIKSLLNRFKLAYKAFVFNTNDLSIRLEDDILLDIKNKTIIINGDFKIHSTGNFSLSSDKHIFIQSGNDKIDHEINNPYSIWFNTEKDHNGLPIINPQLNSDIIEANQTNLKEKNNEQHNIRNCSK